MTSSGDGQPAQQRPPSPAALPATTQPANGDAAQGAPSSSEAHDNFTADAANSALTQPPPKTPPPHRSQDASGAQQINPVTPANGHDVQMTDAQALGAAMAQGNGFSNAPMDIFGQHHPVANYNLMMALAMSANQASPLPTVTPSQVSLPNTMNDGGDPLAVGNGLHPAAAAAAAAGQNLESFARIEFADSTFQMTTYAVIIGRDQRALEQARLDEKRAEQHQRHIEENAALGLPPPSPPQDYRGKFSKSYVSEEGGMLGPESDGEDNPRPAKRRKTNSGGSNSNKAEQQPPPDVDEQNAQGNKKDLISDRQYVSHTPGAAAVDLASLRPSPYHVPFIGIHSPGPNIAANTKAISREHLKIQFNQEKGVFEAVPLHRNGFFHEEVHHREEKVVLRSGDHLQIKDVEFSFIINGVPEGKTGAEQYFDDEEVSSKRCYSEGGKEMSFEFESSHGGELRDTSEDESEKEEAQNEGSEDEGEEEEEEGNEDEDEEEVLETVESDQEVKHEPEPEPEPLPLQLPMPPKKRGPGRPPKNGIMSKREERLLKKQAQEAAKKKLPQPPPGEPPIKRKVGRPRKHPLPENQPDKPEKRKYKPRKPKDEADGSDAEKAPKEKRREKPKTPPLELKMEDFTEEQLQKPNKNYGVLIDEVLSDAPPEGLTLKQIYKRIQKRYPYYFFVVDTKGWESSVRHNLIGNDAFKKNEETHLWCRVPGIELDAGKKRKAASPDQTAASMYNYPPQYQHQMGHQALPQGNVAMGAQGYPPGTMPPQRFPSNGQVYPGHQGSPPFAAQSTAQGNQGPGRPGYPSQAQGPAPAQLPGYGTPSAPRPQISAQPVAYSSPYAAKAPSQPTGPAQPGVAPGVAPPMAPQAPGPAVQAGQPPIPQHGLPQVHQGAASTQNQPARSSQPPAPNGAAAPLRPAVDPPVVSFIKKFSTQVVAQLDKRTPRAEAIAMSVVNRGLGLAQESIVPEHDAFEKVILTVFETYKTSYPKQLSQETTDPAILARAASGQFLDPQLVLVILRFKASMLEIIKSKLGAQKSEVLILSAIDRVLGFTDKTVTYTESEAERKEFADAENILIPALKAKIDEYLRSQPPPSR